MANRSTTLTYHLPRSWVRVSGTATTKKDLRSGRTETSAESTVEIVTVADPDAWYAIDFGGGSLAHRALTFELSEQGLLTSTAVTSTGQLGKVVASVVSFATTVVSAVGALAARFALTAVEGEDDSPEPVDALYEREHPDRAQRRAHLKRELPRLRRQIEEHRRQICQIEDEPARKRLGECIATLTALLKDLEEEAKEIDLHFQAWMAAKEAPVRRTHTFLVPVRDLPQLSDVVGKTPEDAPLGAFRAVYDALRIVVARTERTTPPTNGTTSAFGSAHRGIFHRQPRPVQLTILDPVASDAQPPVVELRPVSTSIESILDEHSRLGYIEFPKSRWSKRAAQATFGASGALTKLSNERASELAAASGALAEAPAGIAGALDTINKIVDHAQTLSLQGITHRISELEKEKTLLQARIARDDLIATQQLASELHEIQAELDLLKARQALGSARRAVEENLSDVQFETEILKVKTELERAQIERLKVQAELRKLQGA